MIINNMNFITVIILTVLVISLTKDVYCADSVMCNPDLECPSYQSVFYKYDCCKDEKGEDKCCRWVNWKNITIIVLCVLGIVIILLLANCLFGFCKCFQSCFSCCCKDKK
uniref:Uncharacterized protein n=1 Tax=Trichobilharzia regenti TaxID=157069 RepID=A0AA85JLH7_TRIRE|nr:unnamed protein product [Trichobilharzia regenti]